jgi:hypothetical protein
MTKLSYGRLHAMDGSEAPSPHSTDRVLDRGYDPNQNKEKETEETGNAPGVSRVGREERFCFTHRLSPLLIGCRSARRVRSR